MLDVTGVPEEVLEGARRLRVGDAGGPGWILRWMSQGARDRVDRWLVERAHPLASEPGTQEHRFLAVCAEWAARLGEEDDA
jgi:hypothetical protein